MSIIQQPKHLHFAEWEKYVYTTAKQEIQGMFKTDKYKLSKKKLRKEHGKDTGKVFNPHSSSN